MCKKKILTEIDFLEDYAYSNSMYKVNQKATFYLSVL